MIYPRQSKQTQEEKWEPRKFDDTCQDEDIVIAFKVAGVSPDRCARVLAQSLLKVIAGKYCSSGVVKAALILGMISDGEVTQKGKLFCVREFC